MQRQRDGAVGTHRDPFARAALHERRVAAPVQQEDALLASSTRRSPSAQLERLAQHAANPAAPRRARFVARAFVRRSTTSTRGSAPPPTRAGKREQPVLPRARVLPALEAWRRAAEHAHGAGLARPHDRDLARVVARRFALLVARLVLLVHDDRAEIGKRGEDRRPRADRDAPFAAAQREPRVVALAVAEAGVQHRDLRVRTPRGSGRPPAA